MQTGFAPRGGGPSRGRQAMLRSGSPAVFRGRAGRQGCNGSGHVAMIERIVNSCQHKCTAGRRPRRARASRQISRGTGRRRTRDASAFCLEEEEKSGSSGKIEEESGAAEGTRTPDPIITNDVLYQLSYSGVPDRDKLPRAGGVFPPEPAARSRAGRLSGGLSLRRFGRFAPAGQLGPCHG